MKDRYPRGSVDKADYERLRNSIRDTLLSLTVDGERAIKKVYFREELYHGHCLIDAPDLVAFRMRDMT
jgi:predicted AlkP superfamily phosphohydrolase/phosphomutase